MTFFTRSARWLAIATLAGAGLSIAVPAIAQDTEADTADTDAEALDTPTTDLDPLEGLGNADDDFNTFGDTDNPFELIHRAIFAPSVSSEQFQRQQQRRIGAEAASFRERQQEALRDATAQPSPAEEAAIEADDATVSPESEP